MKKVCLLFLIYVLVSVSQSRYVRKSSYSGDVLVKCSGLERERIVELVPTEGIDVWKVANGGRVDFRVAKSRWPEMKEKMAGCEEVGSVEKILRRAEKVVSKQVSVNETQAEWFEEYHKFDEIVAWYNGLSEKYSDITKFVESIGESIEGRSIPAFHITASSDPRKIFFQCQIHAREWISGATCSYIAEYLVSSYDNDERVTNLLNEVEFILVPIINPDGYEYSWTSDRLWLKNRRITGSSCNGVNLNRNYPDHWNERGSSDNPCSEVYHGDSAASEPEIKASINYFKSQSSSTNPIIGAIDWHSYGHLILRPYGWTSDDAPDEDRLKELGDMISSAICSVNKQIYTNQKSNGLYPTTGTADDWFYSDDANENNGDYRSAAYTIELPDTGRYGFLLPPSEIVPTGKEVVAGVLVFAESLLDVPLKKKE